jgi:hypothetical protein
MRGAAASDAAVRALAQAAARTADAAAEAPDEMPPRVTGRLPEATPIDLAREAAQQTWAARTRHALTATLRRNDPAAQARAARVGSVLIAAAADSLTTDVLMLWTQHACAPRRQRARRATLTPRCCAQCRRRALSRPTRRSLVAYRTVTEAEVIRGRIIPDVRSCIPESRCSVSGGYQCDLPPSSLPTPPPRD